MRPGTLEQIVDRVRAEEPVAYIRPKRKVVAISYARCDWPKCQCTETCDSPNEAKRKADGVPNLTKRERDYLAQFCIQTSGKLIAAEMGVTETTSSSHRRTVMTKLGLECDRELTLWCLRNGYLQA